MINVLIIEDDADKAANIVDVIKATIPNAVLDVCQSYNSGLTKLLEESAPSLLILDMSMHTFDVSKREKGGRSRIYAGQDILEELCRYDVVVPVIVVTQYDKFSEGTDIITLNELAEKLRKSFPALFRRAIYYHAKYSNWRSELATEVKNILQREDTK